MTKAQTEAIEKHGRQLLAIFPDAIERDPIKLCKRLRRIEREANMRACAACNNQKGADEWEYYEDKAMAGMDHLLILRNVNVFVNADPRGYALKIDDQYMREHALELHCDWGGYGIIAPEIDKDGR